MISLAAISVGNVAFLFIYDYFRNPWVFIATLFPVSILFGMTFTNGPAYVSFIRPEQKGRFMGFLVMYQSIGSFIGTATGGFLYANYGISSIFIASIFLPLVGIFVTAVFLEKTPPAAPSQTVPAAVPKLPESKPSKTSLWQNPVIQTGLTYEFLLWFGVGTFYVFFGIFYVQELNGPVQFVGVSTGLASLLGAIVGFGLGALADKKSPVIILAYAWVGYFIVFAGLFFQRNPVAAAIYWSLPIYVEFIGMNKIIAERTEEEERNRGIAAATIARNSGTAVGVIMGGLLSFWISLDQILATTLVLFIPSLIFLVKTQLKFGKSRPSL
jgi:predicted MFS family arabinose efflux permease